MVTTVEEQLALELINRARANPEGEFDEMIADAATQTATASNVTSAIRYFDVDMNLLLSQLQSYDSVDPLAWNNALGDSATTHTELMIEYDQQSHNLPGEPGVGQRMRDAGYDNLTSASESVYAYAYDVEYAHAGFYIDWGFGPGGIQDPAGHREAMLNANYKEVGIAWIPENDSSTDVGPNLTTQHFGNRWDYEAQLLGVVIDDMDNDDFYDIGEGLGGIAITATGSQGTFVTASWASGGYQMVLPDGVYTVTFEGTGLDGVVTKSVTISGANKKLDAEASEAVAVEEGLTIVGSSGEDDIVGSEFDDELRGMQANDTITAGNGDDQVWGASGDDSIFGEGGNDFLRGSWDEDYIDGGAGNDNIRGQKHSDMLIGGTGDDDIRGGGGNDDIYGGADNDYLTGGTRFDEIFGGGGNDSLFGNRHDDSLFGGDGDDLLNGGGNNDLLDGGSGNDDMKGGDGADVFVFDTSFGVDTIEDFAVGADMLRFTAAVAEGRSAADLAATADLGGNGLVLYISTGNSITLEGVTSSTGLESAIDIV
ncbi:MAG: CAP domain-containing protein [Pseudomonadota bacterium]